MISVLNRVKLEKRREERERKKKKGNENKRKFGGLDEWRVSLD